jgi:hypothetical protein
LAVVLWPEATKWFTEDNANDKNNEIPIDLRPFVSQWGMDPIWTSTPLTELLGPEHFLNKVGTTGTTRTLPEFEVAATVLILKVAQCWGSFSILSSIRREGFGTAISK